MYDHQFVFSDISIILYMSMWTKPNTNTKTDGPSNTFYFFFTFFSWMPLISVSTGEHAAAQSSLALCCPAPVIDNCLRSRPVTPDVVSQLVSSNVERKRVTE